MLGRSAARPTDRWFVLGAALTAQIGFSVPEQGLPTLAGFLQADLSLSAAATGLFALVAVMGYQGLFVTMLTEAAPRDRVGVATGSR